MCTYATPSNNNKSDFVNMEISCGYLSPALVWTHSHYSWYGCFNPNGLAPCPATDAVCQVSLVLWSFLFQETPTSFLMGEMQSKAEATWNLTGG